MSDAVAASPVVHAVGWALLHSLWQGSLAGVLTAALLSACRHDAAGRYVVAYAGLIAMVTLPTITALTYTRHVRPTMSIDASVEPRDAFSPPRLDAVRLAAGALNGPSRAVATAAANQRPEQQLETWSMVAVPIWLAGVLVFFCRLLVGWTGVRRLRRTGIWPVEDDWRARIQSIADRLRLTRPVLVAASALAEVPIVIGWLRPMMLIPVAVFTGLPPAQLEAVIAHELAHIRRGDYLINLLQTTAEVLLFYHPATWWVSQQIRIEREHCCDDIAVELCGDRATYACALATLEELRGAHAALALGANGGLLLSRIRRLLGRPAPPAPLRATSIAAGVVVSAMAVAVISTGLPGGVAHHVLDGFSNGIAPRSVREQATITGRIVDAHSRVGLAGASIEVIDSSGEHSLNTAVSDLEGRYAVHGVWPGEYRVFAQAEAYVEGQYGQRQADEAGVTVDVRPGELLANLDVGLQLAGGVTGRITSESGEGLTGAEIELLTDRYVPGGVSRVAVAFGYTEDAGRFRLGELPPGEYYVRAYPSWPIRPAASEGRPVYGLTYFPSVSHPETAQPIVVQSGQVLFDIDFALAAVRTRTVSGQLIDAVGESFEHAEVMLSMQGVSSPFSQTAPVAPDGRFQVRDVVPGDYLMTVNDRVRWNRWLGGASRQITVEQDVSGVQFVAQRGTRLDGRIVDEAGSLPPFDLRVMRLGITTRDVRPGGVPAAIQVVDVTSPGADGTFSIENMVGRSALWVHDVPAGWMVKAIRSDGMDIADEETDFGERSHRSVEIVLTDRITSVAGIVTDTHGHPRSNYTVVVFPLNSARWPGPSRLIRGVRPRRDGSYRVEALPSGDYLVAAVDSLPLDAWNDAAVLARLSRIASPFRLGDAENRRLDVPLAAMPPGLETALAPERRVDRQPALSQTRARERPEITRH
jgi:beta-lactamase regulating signal transducer with metallopeptidase domain